MDHHGGPRQDWSAIQCKPIAQQSARTINAANAAKHVVMLFIHCRTSNHRDQVIWWLKTQVCLTTRIYNSNRRDKCCLSVPIPLKTESAPQGAVGAKVLIIELVTQILGFHRPVAAEHVFNAAATGPAPVKFGLASIELNHCAGHPCCNRQ